MYTIPFIRYAEEYARIRTSFLSAIDAIAPRGEHQNGPEVRELETLLANSFELDYCCAVGSGTSALIIALKALGLKRGSRVAVTAFSFVASATALLEVGAIPVFVDIDEFYQMNTNAIHELIRSRKIDAILAVHIGGQMMNIENFASFSEKNGIKIVEDAAQVFGSTFNNQPPGQFSDLTCVSFSPTKVIGAYGNGGCILTSDAGMHNKIRALRWHGMEAGYVTDVGLNGVLDSIQAVAIKLKINEFETSLSKRAQISATYDKLLSNSDFIQLPKTAKGCFHNHHKYVIRVVKDRAELLGCLKQHGIEAKVHYTLALHLHPVMKNNSVVFESLENSIQACKEVVSLPIYADLKISEVEYICEVILEFFNNR